MQETHNLGRSQQVPSVLTLQKTICMRIGANSSPQDLSFCSEFLLPPTNKGVNTVNFSVRHTHIIYTYLLCIRQLFLWTFLGSGSLFLFVNPVLSLALVTWEAPAYLKTMASFVFPSSYCITCWCTSDIPSTRLMKAPFFFIQVILRQ